MKKIRIEDDVLGRLDEEDDRKLLATFYTLPEAAALLADLAVGRLDLDWSKPEAVTAVRVADLSCGTGTLLEAAYRSMAERYRNAGGDDTDVLLTLRKEGLIGADIMPAATRVAASRLSSIQPEVPRGSCRYIRCLTALTRTWAGRVSVLSVC